jgi:hypothetical protein
MNLSPFQVMRGFGAGAKFRAMAYAGDRRGALALLEESRIKLPHRGAPNTIGSWALLLSAVEGLFVMGERGAAAQYYPLVRELIDTGIVCMGWIARFPQTIAALAAAGARNWNAAEGHLTIALRQAQEFPHRLEVAEVKRVHAMMLLERGGAGDWEQAHQLLAQARATYQQLGMSRHVELTGQLAATLR